jgi:hypothetical protein
MTTSSDPSTPEQPRSTASPWWVPVRHPNLYLWLIFVSALDVILTRVILFFGGTEVNPVADFILQHWGRLGMSIFKFTIVGFVIIACEFIARRKPATSRRLAIASIIISMMPVLWSCLIITSLILNPPVGEEGLPDAEGFDVHVPQLRHVEVLTSKSKETAWPIRLAS